jgi:hypothetical protein
MRSAPTSLRIVDVNGDSGLHARLDKDRFDAEVVLDHSGESAVERRNNRRNDRAVERRCRGADEQFREDAVFVGGTLARCGQPPRADQRFVAIDAEDDVRVDDVDDQEVGHLGIGYYGVIRSPALMAVTSSPVRRRRGPDRRSRPTCR